MAETTVPFFLGDPIEKAHSKLGTPDRARNFNGQTIESFVDYGVCVTSDESGIVEISASWFEIDEKTGKFDGKIHGIALGDSIDSHFPRLGDPQNRKEYSYGAAKFTWCIEEYFLVIEIQTEAGNDEDMGSYEPGFVSDIAVKRTIMNDEQIQDAAAKMIQETHPDMPLDKIKQGLTEMNSDPNGG